MAAKIKDGLFIGDAETSQSEVFINDNKISNLINVAGRDVPNLWAAHGLVYLTYNWEDRPDYRLLSGHEDSALTDIVEFIDVSISHGISVLIFSKRGTGRCIIAACLYLMMKYRWGFEKSYDYVFSKKPDVDLNKGFIQQMFALDMKLLASRQKAYALKHGIDNGFRIEPNMTINDIASMLPVNEAKRWNSWDPSYILNPTTNTTASSLSQTTPSSSSSSRNSVDPAADPLGVHKLIESEENIHWQKYGDNVVQTIKRKDYNILKSLFLKQRVNTRALHDMEEELVLIFSFINSKNTITALPGPYHNAYDIPKHFKLRFDQVVFEEDVNWFPSAPSSRAPVRGILKGVQSTTASAHPPNSGLGPQAGAGAGGAKSREDKDSSSLRHSIDKASTTRDKPASAYAPASSGAGASGGGGGPEDLYKFVGMSAQPKDSSSQPRTRDEKKAGETAARYEQDKTTAFFTPSSSSATGMGSSGGVSGGSGGSSAPTAEERLRKLMADMQKQAFYPDHLKPATAGTAPSSAAGMTGDGYYSSGPPAPSLYDLANMHVTVHSVHSGHEAKDTTTSGYRSGGSGYHPTGEGGSRERDEMEGGSMRGGSGNVQERIAKAANPSSSSSSGYPQDNDALYPTHSSMDPLAAFDLPRHLASSSGPTPSAASATGKGAMRARHDILAGNGTSAGSGMGGARSSGSGSSLRTSTTRQAWAAPASPSANSSTAPRYASPSTRGGGGGGHVSSNLSVNSVGSAVSMGSNGTPSAPYVGSGTNSSAKVYRHGSPAPNTRPAGGGTPSRLTGSGQRLQSGGMGGGSSNLSVTSMSSLGSTGSNQPPPPGRYASPQVNRTSGSGALGSSGAMGGGGSSAPVTGTRYASPTPSSGTGQPRRPASAYGNMSSQNSVGSTGSGGMAQPLAAADRRKAYGTSPMRSSYQPPSSPASGYGSRPSSPAPSDSYGGGSLGGSKRFTTPTPQSAQHHDFDSNGHRRPSTPTRSGWKI